MTGHSAAELWPLAEAKLAAPRQRSGLVDRPRILQVLDAGADAALTLVAAPPGFGKSTAVRAWCASRTEPLAWVTLDARDNDPVRLWTYIATAVDRIRPGLGRRTLGLLGATADVSGPLDDLLNRIGALGTELVIVLDDLQTVTDREALASIDYAVEHLPANARLIVITRIDPALGLARLRAGGALAELRADDLAFTVAETRELLVERGKLAVGDDEIELLHARTEGWPAALVLATLWLRRVPDLPAAVREFGGDQRFVADYLLSEVIGSLDADIRPFVLRVSVLGRFTAELCDGVFDRSDSASLLAELEHSNHFMVRMERGGWYRVHSLLAELAELQLTAHEPGAVADTHRRAAHWLRSKGLAIEAADHAIAAGDHELLAELLVEHHLMLIRTGGARTLLRWVGDAACRAGRRASRARRQCGHGGDDDRAGRRAAAAASPRAPRGSRVSRTLHPVRPGGGGHGAGGGGRHQCRGSRPRGPPRGRDRGSRGGPSARRCTRRLCPRALSGGRGRRRMGSGAPGGRAPGCSAPRPRPCVRPVDAGARRGGARTGGDGPAPRRRRPVARRRGRQQPKLAWGQCLCS